MKNQVQTRLAKEDIEIIAKLAREAHMTFAAMLRRLMLERLEEIAAAGKGEPDENAQTPQSSH
ncbi:MAG: hypothetical protein LIO94_04470 [Clostridiales bacterium]|nr:hypothetical protein [Clostridiales bacterium]